MPINVILADGHCMVRQGLAVLLAGEPDVTLVAQAGNAETAWGLIQTLVPAVAIVCCPMPGASGLEIAHRVAAAALDTRVLLLAADEDPGTARLALHAGVSGFVLKGSPFDELIFAVRTLAAGETFVSPPLRSPLRAVQRGAPPPVRLSAREHEVVRLLAEGKSSKEIARVLAVSPSTVETHRKRMMKKLGLHSVAEVVRWGVRGGVVV